jgi:hypothetical protein
VLEFSRGEPVPRARKIFHSGPEGLMPARDRAHVKSDAVEVKAEGKAGGERGCKG